MTLQAFQDKWNGKFCDFDGKWGFQCTDLARQYIQDVLGLPPYTLPAVSYAKQLFQNFKPNKYFTKVANLPTNAPKAGDIVVWNTYPFITGIAGHVGICTSANTISLIVFNQNYPTGSPCSLRKFNYKGVLGWISPTNAR
jgi:hypothetical protein